MAACLCVGATLCACRPEKQCLYTEYEHVTRGVTITSERDFEQLEGRCVLVRGDLLIESPVAVDLSPLAGVVGVSGDLTIRESHRLESVSLDLEFVGGDLRIQAADSLTEVDLPSLQSVGGRVKLSRLPALGSLAGFPALTDIGGSLTVEELSSLEAWDLDAVEYIGGDLLIASNEGLRAIEGSDALFEVGRDIEIRGQPRLESVAGFDGLDRVRGDLIVTSDTERWEPPCPPAEAASPGTIGGLFVTDTVELRRLVGFSRIHAIQAVSGLCGSTGNFSLQNNLRLEAVDVFSGLESLDAMQIGANPSLTTIPSWPSYELDDLSIVGQPGIVDLGWFAGASVEEAFVAENPDLRSTDGLAMQVNAFTLHIYANPLLERVAPLSADSIHWLAIANNPSLTDVSGLRDLERVQDALYVMWNESLDQQAAEADLAHLGPTGIEKVAGNRGWELPEICPWPNDRECDESDDYGPPLCMLGTDTGDCVGP